MRQIFFVIVLHRCGIAESRACRAVKLLTMPDDWHLAGLVFDNTPGIAELNASISENVTYLAAGRNMGLPAAYNAAIREAKSRGADHLLLLDQDSPITQDFIDAMMKALADQQPNQVVWVPRIFVGERCISPYRLSGFGLPRYGFDACSLDASYYAINSYSVIALSFLEQIGGFDEFYWLDALDSWFYARVVLAGKKVGLIDVDVQHELSLLAGNLPSWRMLNIARYETCFIWASLPIAQAIGGTARVMIRGVLKMRLLLANGAVMSYLAAVGRGIRSGLSRR